MYKSRGSYGQHPTSDGEDNEETRGQNGRGSDRENRRKAAYPRRNVYARHVEDADEDGQDGDDWDQQDDNADQVDGVERKSDHEGREHSYHHQRSAPSLEERRVEADALEERFGFARLTEGSRLGWLMNMQPTSITDPETNHSLSAVDCYLIQQDGLTFKATVVYSPYFYVSTKFGHEEDVIAILLRKFDQQILSITIVEKEDLDLNNHLSGLRKTYLKIQFRNVQDLLAVRQVILPLIANNKKSLDANETYGDPSSGKRTVDFLESMIDIREYDVTYYVRMSIDLNLRVGYWYVAQVDEGKTSLQHRADLLGRAEPLILAFDIETTKLPLRFPDASIDQIMMISYILDRQGYLIVNREIVSEDIQDFEYTPKPEYEGPFIVFNEVDEVALLKRFFSHIQESRPSIFVTFNGDSFDWPFVEARASFHRINMYREIGFRKNIQGEYNSRFAPHMDVFRWVKRDSYLPQGSHGLKAVTKAKLGYDPLELDPEEMVNFARTRPQVLASYSVSDAVATFYMYMKYVHPFIFSLCTIIPMNPDDVLRKGSGTLCEQLLMVQAYLNNIICPNKQVSEFSKLYKGHLLESETYIGGHVECLESGVYRSDFDYAFKIDPAGVQKLIDDVENVLNFAIDHEWKVPRESVTNYAEVRDDIITKLQHLKENPKRNEKPKIYHLDVAAMYPNIILTNRLQPPSVVTSTTCASCDFNQPENNCKRNMNWQWRGEYFPATRSEYEAVKAQLESERFPGPFGHPRSFFELTEEEQSAKLKSRVLEYCRKVYKKAHITKAEMREATICMRENSFYVDTVRAFRDRRYEYKDLHKDWKRKYDDAVKAADAIATQEAKDMIVVYESLQLAHKCILNSFYGYVMRKGARWYSMEMAGIVTHTGARIIQETRQIIDIIGRPLELDTDGIWCMLPSSLPENYDLKSSTPGKSKFNFSYMCSCLNLMVAMGYTNHQYQTLVDKDRKKYEVKDECSIMFEVDGPYKAMIIPASTEEDKLLKKRYAVFNFDGKLAELKGFELKRRGELRIIKIFQSQVFKGFLEGKTLEECYNAVAKIAEDWLDILFTKGANLSDDELIELISEMKSMSQEISHYQGMKSLSITTARRLAEFLGEGMIRDKGLACQFVISKKPEGAPVTERAIPVAIFSAEPAILRQFIKKWCKDNTIQDFDIRKILDWDYYITRFGTALQKIITIPAALQKIDNPIPRIPHPEWLYRRIQRLEDAKKQRKLDDIFSVKVPSSMDIEDFGAPSTIRANRPLVHYHKDSEAMEPRLEETVDKAKQGAVSNQNADENQEANVQKEVVVPDIKQDFKAWLKASKRKWKMQIRQRKDALLHPELVRGPQNARDIFRSKANLSNRPWEVIQIADSGTPGEFNMWVMSGDVLTNVRLVVPRVFYVNSRVEDPNSKGTRTSKLLPRSRPCLNLYEFSVSEGDFVEHAKDITSYINHPDVEGVYESKMPVTFKAVMELGCTCSVKPMLRTKNRPAGDIYSIEELEFKTTTEVPYLQGIELRRIFVYHSHSENRGIFGIYKSHNNEMEIIFVDPFRNLDMPRAKRIMKEMVGENESIIPEFTYNQVASVDEAYALIDESLQKYLQQKRGPTVLVLQSPSTRNIVHHIKQTAQFPCISMAANDTDGTYPALQWKNWAVSRLLQRYGTVADWYKDMITLASYAHIPIGNLDHDYPIAVADYFFARQLRRNNHLLWISNLHKPDLGGLENDDFINVDDDSRLEFCNPGFYQSVCVHLDLSGLAVNTVLAASKINELEGAAGDLMYDLGEGSDESSKRAPAQFDDMSACVPTFKLLRQLINNWATDSMSHGNVFSDMLLVNFYRWIRSPSSRLYDPALYRLLTVLLKKVFLQLVSEFRKLGAKIIYASFNKIILSTNKTSITEAETYIQFILNAIREKELYSLIHLQASQWWDCLLFVDSSNFGCIRMKKSGQERQEFIASQDTGHEGIDIISNWSLVEHFPKNVKEAFVVVVSEFLYKTWESRDTMTSSQASNLKRKRASDASSITRENMDSVLQLEEENQSPLAVMLNEHVYQKLLQIVPKINKSVSSLDGSLNWSLEFVKSVCYVLGLERSLENDVIRIKKILLRLINVGEYSEDAAFKGIEKGLILADTICSFCNNCRDLDLIRDPMLQENVWMCGMCEQPASKRTIEARLIETLQSLMTNYQTQDLECKFCRKIKGENMSLRCKCSRVWSGRISVTDVKQRIGLLRKAAEMHDFKMLSELLLQLDSSATPDSPN
eukprot:TRINITY_DN9949_c0_g1_i1.p1 TRINITY_DN9949_c0_g1~~TRINITY_DN9949_c0_g1_i1.p1  ORF type:complete len:2242 (+),score=458.11 TRINITY_DN9949_c0_g1_i1:64-6789(+)